MNYNWVDNANPKWGSALCDSLPRAIWVCKIGKPFLFLNFQIREGCGIDMMMKNLLLLQCMKNIVRNTDVVSVSLPKSTAKKLDRERMVRGQSRSAFVASLIEQSFEDQRWQRIYKRGEETAKRFGITSEEDIDRILHEA